MIKKGKKSILIITGLLVITGSAMAFSEAGTDKDPLVTLSYVNNRIEQLKNYVDEKIEAKENKEGSSQELTIVELKKGEILIGESGTELILRGGKAKAYGVEVNKGLTDITAGKDIDDANSLLPYNHLLIVPRSDERGVYGEEDAILMVRGDYEVRKK